MNDQAPVFRPSRSDTSYNTDRSPGASVNQYRVNPNAERVNLSHFQEYIMQLIATPPPPLGTLGDISRLESVNESLSRPSIDKTSSTRGNPEYVRKAFASFTQSNMEKDSRLRSKLQKECWVENLREISIDGVIPSSNGSSYIKDAILSKGPKVFLAYVPFLSHATLEQGIASGAMPFFAKFKKYLFPSAASFYWRSTRVCPITSQLLSLHTRPEMESSADRARAAADKYMRGQCVLDSDFCANYLAVERKPKDVTGLLLDADLLREIDVPCFPDNMWKKLSARNPSPEAPVRISNNNFVCVDLAAAHEWFVNGRIIYDKLTMESLVAIDCEMVEGEDGREELGQVCVVDYKGRLLIDEFVKPMCNVVNYRTEFSGLTKESLDSATCTVSDIQQLIFELCKEREGRIIFVGHSVDHDLESIRLIHPFLIDTALLYPHIRTPMRYSLANLVNLVFHVDMRDTGRGHCPRDDAIAAMALAIKKLEYIDSWRESTNNKEVSKPWLSVTGPMSFVVPPYVDHAMSIGNDEFPAFDLATTSTAKVIDNHKLKSGWCGGVELFDQWPLCEFISDNLCLQGSRIYAPPLHSICSSQKLVQDIQRSLNGLEPRLPQHHISTKSPRVVTQPRLRIACFRDYQTLCCKTLGVLKNNTQASTARNKGRHASHFYGGGYMARSRRIFTSIGVDVSDFQSIKAEDPVSNLEGRLEAESDSHFRNLMRPNETVSPQSAASLFPVINTQDKLNCLRAIDSYCQEVYNSMDKGDVYILISAVGDACRFFNMESTRQTCQKLSHTHPNTSKWWSKTLDAQFKEAGCDFNNPTTGVFVK